MKIIRLLHYYNSICLHYYFTTQRHIQEYCNKHLCYLWLITYPKTTYPNFMIFSTCLFVVMGNDAMYYLLPVLSMTSQFHTTKHPHDHNASAADMLGMYN